MDELWVREHGAPGVPFDVFEPDYIQRALVNEAVVLGPLIFGTNLWADLHAQANLPIGCLHRKNKLEEYFAAAECTLLILLFI